MTGTDAWKLPGETHACHACEAPLLPGDVVTTVLRMEAEAPARQDLCEACGEGVAGQDELFFWSRRRPDESDRAPIVDYAMLRELFPRLLGHPGDSYRKLAYLVALVLVRKRALRLVGFEVENRREVMIVTRGAGQPRMTVPAPHLDAEGLLAVREELTRLLHAELPIEDLLDLEDVQPEGAESEPAEGAEPA